LSDLNELLDFIREEIKFYGPISASINPLTKDEMTELRKKGLSDICFSLDAATANLFKTVKGMNVRVMKDRKNNGFSFVFESLKDALEIFGTGHVATHLIVGLGESDSDIAWFLKKMLETGIRIALFSFTPMRGTDMADHFQPSLKRYRTIQSLLYLMKNRYISCQELLFNHRGSIYAINSHYGKQETQYKSSNNIEETLNLLTAEVFRTSGCSGCNRPFYNEMPGGPMYNFPREPKQNEFEEALQQVKDYLQEQSCSE